MQTLTVPPLAPADFEKISNLFFEGSGIRLTPNKRDLVNGRLTKRVMETGCASFTEYLKRVQADPTGLERQVVVDALTTNETYLFREPKHFELLGRITQSGTLNAACRIWSAAGSTGEEAYSIAMVLADRLGEGSWEVFASDLSSRVVERARMALYPYDRAREMPRYYLRKYCLRGTGQYEGYLLVNREIRNHVRLAQINLTEPLPGSVGMFDMIFLRNILIYFEPDKKREIVRRVAETLKPGGYLLIGHSETLNGIDTGLRNEGPSIYRK